MSITAIGKLSEEGLELLSDPIMYEILYVVAMSVGISPEEYLLRFEKVLSDTPETILGLFEKQDLV